MASKNVEVLIGEIEQGEGALPHSHPGIEQVAYLLEGTADVEVGEEKFKMEAVRDIGREVRRVARTASRPRPGRCA